MKTQGNPLSQRPPASWGYINACGSASLGLGIMERLKRPYNGCFYLVGAVAEHNDIADCNSWLGFQNLAKSSAAFAGNS